MGETMQNQRRNAGNVYLEYFVVALAVFLASVAFFDQGNFLGAREQVETAFDALAARIVRE